MLSTRGYASKSPTSTLEPFTFERRDLGPHDVLIEIMYCGIYHSDINQARNEWAGSIFPMPNVRMNSILREEAQTALNKRPVAG
jgi:alcohol dehydrogenase (NADP+)